MFVDTWAWVEIFQDTVIGRKTADLIEGKTLVISALTIAEIAAWCSKTNREVAIYLNSLRENCMIISVTDEDAQLAGVSLNNLRQKVPGIGMIDVIIYNQAISLGLPLLTGDPHFRKLEGVTFLG
ncbi:MAG: PIN domain-containing protein [Candidatus Micrarchaeota archaeon]